MRYSKERLEEMLAQGNKKSLSISTSNSKIKVANFSIMPYLTCKGCNGCEHYCYAMKSLRYPSTQNAWASNTKLTESKYFVGMMIQELSKLPEGATFRIHQSGDFYSQQYINAWVEIVDEMEHIDFYFYTKAYKEFDFSELNNRENVSSIASVDDENIEDIDNFDKVATVSDVYSNCGQQTKGLECGVTCKQCSIKGNGCSKIIFKKH